MTAYALQAAEMIEWFQDGQKAVVSLPSSRKHHAAAWVQFVGITMGLAKDGAITDPIEAADEMLVEYRKRFG